MPAFDEEVVRELMRDDSEQWVETCWGEGWKIENFARHYADLGFDVV